MENIGERAMMKIIHKKIETTRRECSPCQLNNRLLQPMVSPSMGNRTAQITHKIGKSTSVMPSGVSSISRLWVIVAYSSYLSHSVNDIHAMRAMNTALHMRIRRY